MTERQIFERALEIAEPAARAAWLDEACAGNAALRAGVEALLASHEAQSGFLRVPAVEQIDPHATAPSGVDAPPPRPADATIVGEAGAEGSLHLSAPDGGVGGRGPDDVAAGPDLSFLSPATRPDSLGRIGHYEVLKVLGQGGFGIVLKAFDDALHRIVAIKVLLPQLAATSPPRKRFIREARAAAKVKHENVVQIYAIEEEPLPYLVMEYIDGPTLQEKLDECGPLETAVLLDLGRQIAAGLAAAHAQGLVHRDIKPGNILLEQGIETKIKLTDFGLARTTDDAALTHSGVIVGTPMYMAPEQALGQPVDARSDLFSLGSVLYQMASGRPPFRAPTLLAVLKRVADEQPRPIREILADVPDWLCDLIAQLHEKNPAARIQTAKEVADRLACGPVMPPPSQAATKRPRGNQPATTVDYDPGTTPQLPPSRTTSAFGGLIKLLAAIVGSIALIAMLAVGTYFASMKKGDGTTKIEVPYGARVEINPDSSSVPRPSSLDPRPSWHGWPADAPKPAIAPFDAAQAKKHQEEWAAYLKIPVEHTNSLGMKFVLIPPGEFTMGSTPEEIAETLKQINPNDKHWQECVRSETPQHKVILTKPIYLGVNEVTQAEYEKLMGRNPSFFATTGPEKQHVEKVEGLDTLAHPVEGVSWNDATEFCAKLSQQEKLKPFYFRAGETITPLEGTGYRLPTEAEWEFACRAGTTTRFWIGDTESDLLKAGWFGQNSGGRTHAAGELRANPFGLFDIHGNVFEWVEDAWDPTWYGRFQEKPANNPDFPHSTGSQRVIRGGHWGHAAFLCRSSTRLADDPPARGHAVGFRVSLVAVGPRAGGSTRPADEQKPAEPRPDAKTSTTTKPAHVWPADAPKPAIAPFDAVQAKKHQEEWAAYLKVPVEHTNSLGMKFMLIPPGEFTMGSTPEKIEETLKVVGDDKRWQEFVKSEAPRHKVILTQPIYLGVNEVTQAEYEKVMGKNPSFFVKTGPEKQHVEKVEGLDTSAHPVEAVSWNDAAEFCAKLSQQEKLKPFYFRAGETVTSLKGTGYRLPTEAEWEFSCRAGTTTRFWIGDTENDLLKAGWFGQNSGGRTHAAGELRANPFGLFDIHGNVYEWVEDAWDPTWYGRFQEKPANNSDRPYSAGSQRVIRGGYWDNTSFPCRSSTRLADVPTSRTDYIGFRVCLAAVGPRAGGSTRPADEPKPAEPRPDAKTSTTTKPAHVWPADAPKPAIAPFDTAQAKKHQEEWAAYLKIPVEHTNSLGMKFVLIPPGEFTMGSTPEEIAETLKLVGDDKHWKECVTSEAPRHKVILTQPIYLGVTEVTQAEYEKVMGKNPAFFAKAGPDKRYVDRVDGLDTAAHPVEGVNWNDAAEFCAKLSEKEKRKPFYSRAGETVTPLDGTGYRLPTEAEWEFSCQAGTTTKFWIGDKDEDLIKAGWFSTNSGGRTHAVGELKANPLGLFDIHGNVYEWVQDAWDPAYYGQFQEKTSRNPSCPYSASSQRVLRGGGWSNNTFRCRSSGRYALNPTTRYDVVGFRVCLAAVGPRDGGSTRPSDLPKPGAAHPDEKTSATAKHAPVWPKDAPKPAVAPFDAAQAKKYQEEWAAYLKAPVEYTNSVGMKFRLIPPGEFLMGSTADEITNALKYVRDDKHWEACVRSEAPQRVVILERPIYVGMHEVTQAEYSQVMGRNPSHFAKTGRDKSLTDKVAGLDTAGFPADGATWNDAAAFCDTLSQRESLKPFDAKSGGALATSAGTGYRLPTEAEWEFSCRAGTTSKYWIGDADKDLTVAAWFSGNADGRTHAVGELKTNPFGLFDVHGNVWEWVGDWWSPAWYGRSSGESAPDTGGPDSGTRRVVRGGHFTNASSLCRASARRAFDADYRDYMVGFRVALPVEAVRQALKVDGPAIPRTRATSAVSSSVP